MFNNIYVDLYTCNMTVKIFKRNKKKRIFKNFQKFWRKNNSTKISATKNLEKLMEKFWKQFFLDKVNQVQRPVFPNKKYNQFNEKGAPCVCRFLMGLVKRNKGHCPSPKLHCAVEWMASLTKVLGSSSQSTGRSSSPQLPSLPDTPALPRSFFINCMIRGSIIVIWCSQSDWKKLLLSRWWLFWLFWEERPEQ